jgi:hypothetical protein
VVTFERTVDQPFDFPTVELCEAVVGMAGPILEVQQRDDRPLWRKTLDAGRTQFEHLIGPRHMVLKVSVFGALILILFLAVAKGDYRVTAKTVVEPEIRRALSAPVNGYIAEARLRAGDPIRQGPNNITRRSAIETRHRPRCWLRRSIRPEPRWR